MTTKACPKCGAVMTLNTDQGMFACPNGHRLSETLDEAAARLRERGQPKTVSILFRGTVDSRARSLFESGHHYLWQGNTAAALDAFQDALDIQSEFSDARLWLARTLTDVAEKRKQLEWLLANDLGNMEAIRDLMVLDGKLTTEEAERSRTSAEPLIRRVNSVKAETQTLKCPVCGGNLTVDEINNRVVCKFCGHTALLDSPKTADEGASSFSEAMIKRRGQGGKWVIGERLQHCNQCGAERTIPQGRLSSMCPFCGAAAVIVRDAVDSFERPDGLIPFRVDEQTAQNAIRERLKAVDERLYAAFGDNRVVRADMEGVYMPFWVFDALIEVSQTINDQRTPQSREAVRTFQPYQNIRFQDGMNGIAVPAVKFSTPTMGNELGGYHLEEAAAYDPKLLAKYPAALYAVDWDDASLDARSIASAHMRQRHMGAPQPNVEVTVFSFVQQMSFTLMLMPVWMATLVERDGDIRPALVNGQTGRVAVGKVTPLAK